MNVLLEQCWIENSRLPSDAAGAAGRSPDTKSSGMLRIGDEPRRGQLDDNCHVVESADVVERLARRTEGGGRRSARQLRQRSRHRLTIGNDAEELLEVDEERIIARTGEELNAVGRSENRVDRSG